MSDEEKKENECPTSRKSPTVDELKKISGDDDLLYLEKELTEEIKIQIEVDKRVQEIERATAKRQLLKKKAVDKYRDYRKGIYFKRARFLALIVVNLIFIWFTAMNLDYVLQTWGQGLLSVADKIRALKSSSKNETKGSSEKFPDIITNQDILFRSLMPTQADHMVGQYINPSKGNRLKLIDKSKKTFLNEEPLSKMIGCEQIIGGSRKGHNEGVNCISRQYDTSEVNNKKVYLSVAEATAQINAQAKSAITGIVPGRNEKIPLGQLLLIQTIGAGINGNNDGRNIIYEGNKQEKQFSQNETKKISENETIYPRETDKTSEYSEKWIYVKKNDKFENKLLEAGVPRRSVGAVVASLKNSRYLMGSRNYRVLLLFANFDGSGTNMQLVRLRIYSSEKLVLTIAATDKGIFIKQPDE